MRRLLYKPPDLAQARISSPVYSTNSLQIRFESTQPKACEAAVDQAFDDLNPVRVAGVLDAARSGATH